MSSTEMTIIIIISIICIVGSMMAIVYDSEHGHYWETSTPSQKVAKASRAILLVAGFVTLFAAIMIVDIQTLSDQDKSISKTLKQDYGINLSASEVKEFRDATSKYQPQALNDYYTLGTVRQDELNYAIVTNEEGDVKVYIIFGDKMQRVVPKQN